MKPDKKNPLNLSIGTLIEVTGTTVVQYDNDGNRKLVELKGRRYYFVCGIVKKATGVYEKGFTDGGYYGPPEYTQPCLVVDKYHYLYECRSRLDTHPVLVHPNQVIK